MMSLAYNNGYQIAYHAIGDGANHQVLNTYERLLKENPREDPRLRIEHFQVVTPEILTGPGARHPHRDAVYPMPPRTCPWRRTAWAPSVFRRPTPGAPFWIRAASLSAALTRRWRWSTPSTACMPVSPV